MIAVFEGDTDLPVVKKLARDAGIAIWSAIDCAGKDRLDAQLVYYNRAAQGSPWFVLRDLDEDAACASGFLASRRFQPAQWMCFRIAVRELESWLLADHEAVAAFFRVRHAKLPSDPDSEIDPTLSLVNLARKSTRSAIRKAMVPQTGRSAQVGPLYEATIIEFGESHWDLDRACTRSPSLRRARTALRDLSDRWRALTG